MGRLGRPKKQQEGARTSWVVRPPDLLKRLQIAAIEDGVDVSELLCRLAQDWLVKRKRRRR